MCNYQLTEQLSNIDKMGPVFSNETGNLISTCNAGCNCDTTQFRQVCDNIGNKYFSPCLAGCTERDSGKVSELGCENIKLIYMECIKSKSKSNLKFVISRIV